MTNVTAIPNTGRKRRSHSIVPDQGDNYVLGGCQLTYNGSRLAVSAGSVTLLDESGDTVYAIETSSETFVPGSDGSAYVTVDPATTTGEVVFASSAPPAPALELGSLDVSSGATSEVNRDPNLSTGSLSTEARSTGCLTQSIMK